MQNTWQDEVQGGESNGTDHRPDVSNEREETPDERGKRNVQCAEPNAGDCVAHRELWSVHIHQGSLQHVKSRLGVDLERGRIKGVLEIGGHILVSTSSRGGQLTAATASA